MSKIVSLSEAHNNGIVRSPKDALEDALGDIGKNGALEKGKKLIIISLDDEGNGDTYTVNWYQAGMKMSQCVALCEVAKIQFLTEMEYIQE